MMRSTFIVSHLLEQSSPNTVILVGEIGVMRSQAVAYPYLEFAHRSSLFVDDYLFSMLARLMPLMGSVICLFMQSFNIPLSWKKLQLGVSVQWLGWCFGFAASAIALATTNRQKLLTNRHGAVVACESSMQRKILRGLCD